MPRALTPSTSLDGLRREAKRWLKALRAGDEDARTRFARALPNAPAEPTLRDVQLAIAREHGHAGWPSLTTALAALHAGRADASQGDDATVTALLHAAATGDAQQVATILRQHPDLASRRGLLHGHTGLRTALHHAVGATDERMVALLLEHGADPDVRDEGDDATPLHFAAEKGHPGIIRLLVEHGADTVGDGTWHHLDVLGWATCFGTGRRDVVDYLLAHGARWSLWSAVAMDEQAIVRALVAAEPALLATRMDASQKRRTPLHLAALRGHAGTTAALLDLGADPEATDDDGLTPLDRAALDGATAIADLLLARGAALRLPAAVGLARAADVERLLRDDPGALHPGGRWEALVVHAAERAPGAVVELLLRHGASATVRVAPEHAVDGTTGYTALHAAAFHGNREAAEVLLRHGADPNARESRWCGTPAGWARYAGHAAVAELILAGPIDLFEAVEFGLAERIPEIVRGDPAALGRRFGEVAPCAPEEATWARAAGMTALDMAVAQGRDEVVHALRACGALDDSPI